MGTEQSNNIQSPQKKARRQQYVRETINLIKEAKISVERAISYQNFEVVDDLVNQSAQVIRNVLQSFFREQLKKYKQNWAQHNQQLCQMEEQLLAQLQNISEEMPSWQTRPLKMKIDVIKNMASNIKFAAKRATPEINLNQNKLKQIFQKVIDVKFASTSFINKNQNAGAHDNERRSKFSVGRLKGALSTIFASPTKKSRQTLNINKTKQEYHFEEGQVNRFSIPQLSESRSLTQLNRVEAKKYYSSQFKNRKEDQQKRDFQSNRYFIEACEHMQQQAKSMSKPRLLSFDSKSPQLLPTRSISLSQSSSPYKKRNQFKNLSDLVERSEYSEEGQDQLNEKEHCQLRTLEGRQSKIDIVQLSTGRDCSPSMVSHQLKN